MTTSEKEPSTETSNTNDVSTFLSDLNTAIDFRSSSRSGRRGRDSINRFFYTIGSTNILLEKNLNVENIPKRNINKIPHCKEWQEGIISVRGTIVPVVNMRKYLHDKVNIGESSKSKEKSKFLLLNHDEHRPIVLMIDKLPEMVNIKNYSTKKAPNDSPNWHRNTLDDDEKSMIEVDHNELLNQLIKEQ